MSDQAGEDTRALLEQIAADIKAMKATQDALVERVDKLEEDSMQAVGKLAGNVKGLSSQLRNMQMAVDLLRPV